ncbi:hypothetical protein GCM10022276_12090 [Sphingomonas limnosediminicola]|uniref:PEP-CTERM protein-sorting domain-containing protein n=1 Tax=Sphingomonas limnosediminicola TaxID=940133 RepID=A0ABP7L567_9SPHN
MRIVRAIFAAIIVATAAGVAEGRGIVIDFFPDGGAMIGQLGDLDSGDTQPLSLIANYGTGPQDSITADYNDQILFGPAIIPVTLALSNSPGDFLYAHVSNTFAFPVTPVVFTGNASGMSSHCNSVGAASIFDIGLSPPGAEPADLQGGCGYFDFIGSARFEFTDLSGSGTDGDFGLSLFCGGVCADIGFHLGSLSFSSAAFDANSTPSQLTSFELGGEQSSFSFIFRNAEAVPEPATWASILLGFSFVGMALRQQRRTALR